MLPDLMPLVLSLKLATLTTLVLLVVGVPVAYWLAATRSRFKAAIEALVAMPLVLPPSVLGFYLLVALSPSSYPGVWLQQGLGVQLLFSFEGLLLASILFSLPFMVHPVQAGFTHLPPSLREAAYTLGLSPLRTFLFILLPNLRAALVTGAVLSFAHTLGEFGVVLMIGGNIPGVTRLASIAIYDEVESLNYAAAHFYAGILFVVSFSILVTVFTLQRRGQRGSFG